MPMLFCTDAEASAVVAPVAATVCCTSVVSGLTTAVWSGGAVSVYATVTGPVSASTASVPTRARIGALPTSASGIVSVTLPSVPVRPCGSPLSHWPLPLLSRQTSALASAPSITVTPTLVVAGAAGDDAAGGEDEALPPPPPQPASVAS